MKNTIEHIKQVSDKKLYSFNNNFYVGTILKIGENFSTIKIKHGNMYEMEDIGEEFLKNKGDVYEIVSLPCINEVNSNYWDGYEVVYAVEYCIGEVGSLMWYTKGLYKSEDKDVIQKDNMLNEILSLKEKYLNKFKKEANYEDFKFNYKKLSKDEYNFILKNDNVRIANVVVTPHRIEDSKI